MSAIKSVWDNPCGVLTFQGEPLQLRNWLHTLNKLFTTCKSSPMWNESEKVVSEMMLIAIMSGLELMKIGKKMCRFKCLGLNWLTRVPFGWKWEILQGAAN